MKRILSLVGWTIVLIWTSPAAAQLHDNPLGTGTPDCRPELNTRICYYVFSDDTDSKVFPLPVGALISYRVVGDGNAGVRFNECMINNGDVGADCSIFVDDVDRDGKVTVIDQATVFTGELGLEGLTQVPVRGPYGKVVVESGPSSGSAYVAISMTR